MPALVQIEGIGEVFADKLADAKIGTTQTLLKRGATRKGRNEIARQTGVHHNKILAWVHCADLFRIQGVGEEYSELLEAAGVDTVVELSRRKPDHLVEKLREVNLRRHLVRRAPGISMVQDWIRQAKQLPRLIQY